MMGYRHRDGAIRLARECAKLDSAEEKRLAEEGMAADAAEWPPYCCEDYQLLDFGNGRRLERFGEVVLDRPCPAAEPFERASPDLWTRADARFEGREEQRGEWFDRRELPERWTVAHGSLRFELKRTEFGHLGLFPEQAENWEWIARALSPLPLGEGKGEGSRSASLSGKSGGDCEPTGPHPRPLSQRERGDTLKILNLFAYTGGSTLAAAAAGADVVHVDSAKNIVAWARQNAELSGLADAPIRWIVEDALKFAKRESRRGNRYDAVILDPPSYGHGPHGEVWRLSKHLLRLLDLCGELTAGRPRFMLLTCHTPGYDADRLAEMMLDLLGGEGTVGGGPLTIRSANGRPLPSGVVVRWTSKCETTSGPPIPNP
jgi:23S rRNA (cytosine1962-C5)-methyltransferase